MEVVVLETIKPAMYSGETAKFYFKSDEDAIKFIDVFVDHWCHVDFIRYHDDVELEPHMVDMIDVDPKTRAESNLTWGFDFADTHGDGEVTLEERELVNKLIDKCEGGHAKTIN